MPFELNPSLEAEFDRLFDEGDEQMAKAAASFLTEVLDKPGEGQHWPGLPHPSSLPGHYPAPQSRALVESIDAQFVDGGWEFGSFNAPPEAWVLEYPSPSASPITRQTAHGARPWLSKALVDPAMLAQVWRGLDSIFGR